MATPSVVVTSHDVNTTLATTVDVGHRPRVPSVADRIQWVIDHLNISARELSRRAGLQETQVGVVIARYRRNPNAEVTVPVLNAIAKGGGVSAAWLITGRGSPTSDDDVQQHPDELVAEPRAGVRVSTHEPGHRPVLSNLPNWPALLEAAQQQARDLNRSIPPWVWETLANTSAMLTGPLTGPALFDLAVIYDRHGLGRPREPRETGTVPTKGEPKG
jgi:hypothetical protein